MPQAAKRSFLGLSALVAALLAAPPARADTQVLQYAVEHATYGNIGTYTNTVSQNGAAIDVQTELHVAVKMVGISLFHQDAVREERWNNQRLVSFTSDTDDNGNRIDVNGRAEGQNFVVQSPNGTINAPPQVHPSNPWAPFVLNTNYMMSTKTGKVEQVVVSDKGDVTVTLDGHPRRAHEYTIDGDKHYIVWLNEGGLVIGFQSQENGSTVNFVLTRATAAATPQPQPQPLASN